MRRFAVLGLGRFGRSVATTLYGMGYDVIGVDRDEEKVQSLAQILQRVVVADATDEHTIRSLGISSCDCAVVGLGADMQCSVIATLLLKDAGVKRVVAKAVDELHERILKSAGADTVVLPEREMGCRLANILAHPDVMDSIALSREFGMVALHASGNLVGKTLRQLDLRQRYGINVVAIRRGQRVKIAPRADEIIQAGDAIVVIGEMTGIDRLKRNV